MSTKKNEWTWQEISTHNRPDSCWIYIGDDVYDVTPWLPRHPGGEDLILVFAGRDCTEAMRAYHPFSEKPYAILERLKIGKLKGPSELVRWKEDTGFYKTVRQRCGEYFKKKKIDPTQQTLSYECCRLSTIVIYLYMSYLNIRVFHDWGVSFIIRLLFCWVVGTIAVIMALSITHLSSHIPVFRNPTINYYLGWFTLDAVMGFSYDIWLHEHLVGHHQYTNIITLDPNIPETHGEEAIFRCSPNQKWYKRFTYQFLWVPMLAFMVLVDYRAASHRYWVKGLRREIRINHRFLGTRSWVLFILGKALWLLRTFVLPIFVWGCPVLETIALVIMTEVAVGYFIGINLPVNHTTNKVDWPLIRKDEKTGTLHMDSEWAVAQVRTCKDYALDSWVCTHIFGALNNHSCHHLFPALHHTYYQEIYPIVKQTAREWNIELPDVGTYMDVIHDFVENLWDMSAETSQTHL